MPERIVPSDPLGTFNLGDSARGADEKAEKQDRYGEWLADDARIWRVYERLAKLDDDEKVKRWSGGLNNLALFATLFSGITTAFIIESQGDLKPDFSELAYRVQNATAHGRAYIEEPFVVPGQARAVNCLWIASLLLSVSAALIAVMGQDWVEMYLDKPVCNPRQWAEIRTFRLNGVYRWYMPGVIATAPVLLHASLFLFGIGLAIFMTSDIITRNLCIALCCAIAFLYAVTMCSAVLWSSSPFRSPATVLIRRWFCARFQRTSNKDLLLEENSISRYLAQRVTAVRNWVEDRLSKPWAEFGSILVYYCSGVADRCAAVFRQLSYAMFRRGNSSQHGGAAQDTEAPTPAFEPQYAAPGFLPNFLSRFPITYRNHILAQYAPNASNVWADVFCQWFRASFCNDGSAALGWVRNLDLRFRAGVSNMLEDYGPDVSNGWSDIPETPSLALVADSLSWLSSASSSPEVTQLVVLGLCDHVIGLEAGHHPNARNLTQKLRQYVDGHWEHMGTLDLSRYVISCSNTGNWAEHVKQQFREVILAESPISQDFLLALILFITGFRDETLEETLSGLYLYDSRDMPAPLERLCGRIGEWNPISLPIFASIITRLMSHSEVDLVPVGILIVLMNKWHDVDLIPDLRPVEQAFQNMLPKTTMEGASTLATLCQNTLEGKEPQPIDHILHLLISLFIHERALTGLARSTRNLVLSLARAAFDRGKHHFCLAAIFGSSDPYISIAAWADLSAHDINSIADMTVFGVDVYAGRRDLQLMVARIVARCICPPFPLLLANVSARNLLFCGHNLFRLVEDMATDGALPDDLFRDVLVHGGLANLATSLHEQHSSLACSEHFLWVLGAISLWIETGSHVEYWLELFESVSTLIPQTVYGSSGWVWDLVDAIGVALDSLSNTLLHHHRSRMRLQDAAECLLSHMGNLRALCPERTLWADIARQFASSKFRFHSHEWFAGEDHSRDEEAAVSDAESVDTGSSGTIGPADVGASDDSPVHPVPQVAWIDAGGIPQGGP